MNAVIVYRVPPHLPFVVYLLPCVLDCASSQFLHKAFAAPYLLRVNWWHNSIRFFLKSCCRMVVQRINLVENNF